MRKGMYENADAYNGVAPEAIARVVEAKAAAKFDATDTTSDPVAKAAARKAFIANTLVRAGAAMPAASAVANESIKKTAAYAAAGAGLAAAGIFCIASTAGFCAIGLLAAGLGAGSTALNMGLFDGDTDTRLKKEAGAEADAIVEGSRIPKTGQAAGTTQTSYSATLQNGSTLGLVWNAAGAYESPAAVPPNASFVIRAPNGQGGYKYYRGFRLALQTKNSQFLWIGTTYYNSPACVTPSTGVMAAQYAGACNVYGTASDLINRPVSQTGEGGSFTPCANATPCVTSTNSTVANTTRFYIDETKVYGFPQEVPMLQYAAVVQTGLPAWALGDNPALAEMLNNKLSDDAIAAMVNQLLKMLGVGSGLQYDPADPVTAADVKRALDLSPESRPSLADLYRPIAAPGQSVALPATGTSIRTNPSTAPSRETDTATGTAPAIDLGPAGDSTLPSQIADPVAPLRGIKGMLPSFVVVLPDPGCPPISFEFGGFFPDIYVTSHCPVGTRIFPTLTAIMLTVYTIAGLMLFILA